MKIVWSPECRALAEWLRAHNDSGITTIKDLEETLGIERLKLYRCLTYWRRKFLEFYQMQDKRGILRGDPYQKWLVALENFRVNYLIQPLFYDKSGRMYYTPPNLRAKEEITQQRVIHWIKSGQTVANEAHTYHETLPSAALPSELLGDLKLLRERIEDGNVPRCPSCGQNIQENWVNCPSCGLPLQ